MTTVSTICNGSEPNSTSGDLSAVNSPEHRKFPGIQSLYRAQICVTEKIDGINAVVHVSEDGTVLAGSRNQWISTAGDNFGFAQYAEDNIERFRSLGPGYHYGEFVGPKIQRGYGLKDNEFVSFEWWRDDVPFKTVPVMYHGYYDEAPIRQCLNDLTLNGSVLFHGFMQPEGVVVQFEGSKARNAAFKLYTKFGAE